MDRYEIISNKYWRNKITGAEASIYGSHPSTCKEDDQNWEVIEKGYSIRDTERNITGVGSFNYPGGLKTMEDAIAYKARLDATLPPPKPYIRENELDGKKVAYTADTIFRVQVGKGRGAYKDRCRFIGDLAQAVRYYNAINIGNGYKARLIGEGLNKPLLARKFS